MRGHTRPVDITRTAPDRSRRITRRALVHDRLTLVGCIARWQWTSRLGELDTNLWTGEMQCGQVGCPYAPPGTYRCLRHRAEDYCRECGVGLPEETERCARCAAGAGDAPAGQEG